MIDARAQRQRKKRSGLFTGVAIALLLLGAIAGGIYYYLSGWHPSDSVYPFQGIDVSRQQGRIDWQKLPAQGVDFAYIAATDGAGRTDSAFAENWAGAGKAGVRRGASHFFTLCDAGGAQAARFIATVPNDPDGMPPAVDLEFDGNCAARPGLAEFHANLAAFLNAVEAHYGKQAILYVAEDFDTAYGVSAGVDRPLWLRSILSLPEYGTRPWTIWQASSFRRIEGIDGWVDWNVLRGQSGGR